MEAWAKFVVSFNNGRVKGSTGRNEFYSESSDDQKNIIAAQPNAKSLQILSEDLSSKMIALMGQTASYDPAAIISNNPIAEGSDSKKGGKSFMTTKTSKTVGSKDLLLKQLEAMAEERRQDRVRKEKDAAAAEAQREERREEKRIERARIEQERTHARDRYNYCILNFFLSFIY
jgi:hypothetical protein